MALSDELVNAVLGYARARLEELRDAALADVAAFARAAGIPDFDDQAGVVAGHLATARSELDQAAAAASPPIAAGHLLEAVRAVDRAADEVAGKPVREVLLEQVGWAAVTPSALATQLGLPRVAPVLGYDDATLNYTLEGTGKDLFSDPLVLGWSDQRLVARLRPGRLTVSLELKGLEAGIGAGLSTLLGGAGTLRADVTIGVDTTDGLTLEGSVGSRVVLPAVPASGPLDVREVALELPQGPGEQRGIDLGSTLHAALGPVQGTVDGSGLELRIDPGAGTPIAVGPKLPTGIGLVVDTGLVKGGGFLETRPGGYGGALQLRLGPVEVRAVGLLTLEPQLGLVVVMSVTFVPAIDLSFGFTLNAVGGVLGVNHRMDTDALRAQLPSGALDHLLFPPDPVAAAPAILDTLAQVFPPDPGSVVVGPMVEVGWGRPVSFLTAQVGVIVSLPDPAVVIIGRVRIALPAPELPIVDLQATVYGEITPDHLLILVSLRNSRIAGFTVSGDIGFLVRWAGSPELAISAGGFHPRFDPPQELRGMQRVGIDVSPPAILTLRAEAYVAVTSNSVQLGCRVEIGGDVGVASISGYFSFDALVVWAPRFLFMIDLGIGLTVRALGVTLCGVSVQLHLEGPAPWRAEGHATVEILWWDVEVDVGPFQWGDDDNPPPALADPRQLVHAALHRNPGAWQALTPPGADQVARLLPAAPSDTGVTVHPMGLFDVRQHAVPLETTVTRVGANPVPEDRRRVHLGVPLADGTAAGALSEVRDHFSAGSFLDLTDDEKLSRPSFEEMPAGARIRPPGEKAEHAAAREVELRYETFVCDDAPRRRGFVTVDHLVQHGASFVLAAGAAGASELRAGARYAVAPDPIVLGAPGEVVRADKATLTASGDFATYTHAAESPLGNLEQLVHAGVL